MEDSSEKKENLRYDEKEEEKEKVADSELTEPTQKDEDKMSETEKGDMFRDQMS